MNKFKIGDRVRIVNTPFSFLNGQETTVVSNGCFMYNLFNPEGTTVYEVDMKLECVHSCDLVGIPEINLRLIYDGNEKTEWDDRIFKPSDVELVGEDHD